MINPTHPAILVSADTPKQLRPCDAWRVYEEAVEMGGANLTQVIKTLKTDNHEAYVAMMEYEDELREEALEDDNFDCLEDKLDCVLGRR